MWLEVGRPQKPREFVPKAPRPEGHWPGSHGGVREGAGCPPSLLDPGKPRPCIGGGWIALEGSGMLNRGNIRLIGQKCSLEGVSTENVQLTYSHGLRAPPPRTVASQLDPEAGCPGPKELSPACGAAGLQVAIYTSPCSLTPAQPAWTGWGCERGLVPQELTQGQTP